MASPAHPIACRCGAITGEVAHPERGVRAVCYCRDCQAYGHFLGPPDGMLDALGGTEIISVRPHTLRFDRGVDRLACMSLSSQGTLRWYAACCRTPIGNTPRDIRFPHVGLVHTALTSAGRDLTASFGPIRMRIYPQGAHGTSPAIQPVTMALAVARFMASVAWTRISGAYRQTPFFDAATGAPRVTPQVLTSAERDAVLEAAARPPVQDRSRA